MKKGEFAKTSLFKTTCWLKPKKKKKWGKQTTKIIAAEPKLKLNQSIHKAYRNENFLTNPGSNSQTL